MRRQAWIGAAAALSLAGCAPHRAADAVAGITGHPQKSQAHIDDQVFARIPPNQLSGVEEARNKVRQAEDRALRADQSATLAAKRAEVSKKQIDIAKAQHEAAKADVALAQATGERARIDATDLDERRAQARIDLATAEADYQLRLADQVKQEANIAHDRAELASAELEQAKYEALKASGDASIDRYEAGAFERAFTDAQSAVERDEAALQGIAAILPGFEAKLQQARAALERVDQQPHPVRGNSGSKSQPPSQD